MVRLSPVYANTPTKLEIMGEKTFDGLNSLNICKTYHKHTNDKYGANHLKAYRKLLTDRRRLEKSKLDQVLPSKCKTYDVVPKFLSFKIYLQSAKSEQFYKSWQVKLLNFEMSQKTSRAHKHSANILEIKSII